MPENVTVKGIIDRLEENWAVIKLEKNQEVLWPRSLLVNGLKEGSVVYLSLSDSIQETVEHQTQAKEILNEILNVSTDRKES